MKKLIVSLILVIAALPASHALSKDVCTSKPYEIRPIINDKATEIVPAAQVVTQKFSYCAGQMTITEAGNITVGDKLPVKVVVDSGSDPACRHIHSVFVNDELKGFLDKYKGEQFSFNTCLMPRLFKNTNAGIDLFIGAPNFYNPRLANLTLMKMQLKTTSELRLNKRGRLADEGVNLPDDNATCKNLSPETEGLLEMFEGFNTRTDTLLHSGTATCGAVLDSLSSPRDIFPRELFVCSKADNNRCKVPSINPKKNIKNSIIQRIIAVYPNFDGVQFASLKSNYLWIDFLDTLRDPYADELDLKSTQGSVQVKYRQSDKHGRLKGRQ